MLGTILHWLFPIVAMLISLVAGCGLARYLMDRGRRQRRTIRLDVTLWRLRRLAGCIANDVEEHDVRVRDIGRQVVHRENSNEEQVAQAVNRLTTANRAAQSRLFSAERRLRKQARRIAFHASQGAP